MKSATRTSLTTLAALALGVSAASAHPGHDLQSASMLHVLSSPYHLAVVGLVGTGLLAAAMLVQRAVPRRAMQAAGATAMLVTLVGVAAKFAH